MPGAAPLAICTGLVARPATPGDRAFRWRLLVDTMRPHIEATWGWDEADQRRRFDAAGALTDRHVLELQGEAIGLLHVEFDARPVRLLNLQIAPAHQRQGHGAAVITAVIGRAGVAPVGLQVLKANPARRLYERLGFEVTDATQTHWRMLRAGRVS